MAVIVTNTRQVRVDCVDLEWTCSLLRVFGFFLFVEHRFYMPLVLQHLFFSPRIFKFIFSLHVRVVLIGGAPPSVFDRLCI